MPKQTVKLTYKVSEFIEVEAPTHVDGVVEAAKKLMRGELRPTGKGEIQPDTAHIEMPDAP
jgi:hypothetical protein